MIQNSLITPISSSVLEKELLNNLGANFTSDSVDERILQEYITSSGRQVNSINDTETFFGGYPVIKPESRLPNYDKDRDGMSDKWELDNGLDPANPDDCKEDRNDDGYTNLEDFLHYLTL